jgi:hypothetical protein
MYKLPDYIIIVGTNIVILGGNNYGCIVGIVVVVIVCSMVIH